MRRDQGKAGMDQIAELGERRGTQPDARDEGEHAECAVPAVAHDGELCVAIVPAAKPVGGIGKPVLMQRPGQDEAGEHRDQRRRPAAEPDQLRQEEAKATTAPIPAPTSGKAQAASGDLPGGAAPAARSGPGEECRGGVKAAEPAGGASKGPSGALIA